MVQKPKIQYVGQFYIYGSEARKLEQKKEPRRAHKRLPLARLKTVEKITIEPVALVGIAAAIVLLVVMVSSVFQFRSEWAEYQQMSTYVSYLKKENAELTRTYRAGYDLTEIQKRATALGLIPKEEVETHSITVTIPEPEPEASWWDDVVWFWQSLFA